MYVNIRPYLITISVSRTSSSTWRNKTQIISRPVAGIYVEKYCIKLRVALLYVAEPKPPIVEQDVEKLLVLLRLKLQVRRSLWYRSFCKHALSPKDYYDSSSRWADLYGTVRFVNMRCRLGGNIRVTENRKQSIRLNIIWKKCVFGYLSLCVGISCAASSSCRQRDQSRRGIRQPSKPLLTVLKHSFINISSFLGPNDILYRGVLWHQ